MEIMDQTLAHINNSPRFNQWMFSSYKNYIHWGRIWEIGSGIGNMSQFLTNADFVCLSDYDKNFCQTLKDKFQNQKNIVVESVDLDNLDVEKFKKYRFDTIISTNVIEHIRNDQQAIRKITEVMHDESVLITLVPAHPCLYSEIDRNLGHFRRYTKKSLRELLEEAGHEISALKYFNRFSALGWLMRKFMKTPSIKSSDMAIVETVLPLLKIERFLPLPFGQSVIAVSRKSRSTGAQA